MSEKVYDLIIIGGGVSGVGIAAECGKKGIKALLLDKGSLLEGASKNSLRIIHGGFRYLQTGSLKRVSASIRAKNDLLKKYPEYIKKLPCLLPLNKSGLKSPSPVLAANLIYAALYKFLTGESCGNKILSEKAADSETSLLKGACPQGALLWNDAVINDLESFHSKLRSELSKDYVEVIESCPVEVVTRKNGLMQVKASGQSYFSQFVVNCSGAWVDEINVDIPGYLRNKYKWCKAFNLVLNKKIESKYGVGVESKGTEAKRLYFFVPRGDLTVVGTEYVELDSPKSEIKVGSSEIEAFLAGVNAALPGLKLGVSDVSHTESGVLPYLYRGNKGYALVGPEKIYKYGNYFEILSTKYTTFQAQASRFIKMLPSIK